MNKVKTVEHSLDTVWGDNVKLSMSVDGQFKLTTVNNDANESTEVVLNKKNLKELKAMISKTLSREG